MDLLWNISVIFTMFILIEETYEKDLYKQIWLQSKDPGIPLGLIRNQKAELNLAVPHKFGPDYMAYFYDISKVEQRPKETFVAACMATDYPDLSNDVAKLKKEGLSLLIVDKYTAARANCKNYLVPSIEKSPQVDGKGVAQYCGESKAELYDVGYPVTKRDQVKDGDLEFITIYQICYSAEENLGMLYTIHRIVSPKTMLQSLYESNKVNPEEILKTALDNRDITTPSLYENDYGYQFVGPEDLPTKSWKRTTLFSINYTLITKNEAIMNGMITIDNYIRLFSHENNKPLTIYSGVYNKSVNSFWRVIADRDDNAIMIVTQHTLTDCSHICDLKRVIVIEYKEGGCTYTCSMDDKTKKLLGLSQSPLKIHGDLALTFPRKIPTETKPSEEPSEVEIQSDTTQSLEEDIPTEASQPLKVKQSSAVEPSKGIRFSGLPQFDIFDKIETAEKIFRENQTNTTQSSQDKQQSSNVNPSENVTIFDFIGKSFMSVLKEVDPDLAIRVEIPKK